MMAGGGKGSSRGACASAQSEAYVIAFESTHAAMAAGRALAKAGIEHLTIPVPREISAGCGMALRFEASDGEAASAALRSSSVPLDQISLYRRVSAKEYRLLPDAFDAEGSSA